MEKISVLECAILIESVVQVSVFSIQFLVAKMQLKK